VFRANLPAVAVESDVNGSVKIGSEHRCAVSAQPRQRLRRGMAVGVPEPGRRHRNHGSDSVEEGVGRGGSAAVVRNLQHLDAGYAAGEQGRVDVLLHVAHQKEAMAVHLAQEHDGHVVDPRARVGRPLGHGAGVGPQHPEGDRIEADGIAGVQLLRGPVVAKQPRRECRIPGSWPQHPGLEDSAYPIAIEQPRHPGDVVLVRMRQDEQVDPTIPGRQSTIQRDEQAARIGASVNQQPAATIALDEDRVALADIEDVDADMPIRPVGGDQDQADDARRQRKGEEPRRTIRWEADVKTRRGHGHRRSR
jgi:hypothetical protein